MNYILTINILGQKFEVPDMYTIFEEAKEGRFDYFDGLYRASSASIQQPLVTFSNTEQQYIFSDIALESTAHADMFHHLVKTPEELVYALITAHNSIAEPGKAIFYEEWNAIKETIDSQKE